MNVVPLIAAPSIEERLSNVECEAGLIGALLFDNRQIDAVADRISHEDFSDGLLGRIYSVCVSEHSQGRPVTPVTLNPFFSGDPDFPTQPASIFLSRLVGSGAGVIGVQEFIGQIADLSSRRRLVAGLQEVIELAVDPESTAAALVDRADGALLDATEKGDPVNQVTLGKAMQRLVDNQDKPKHGVSCMVIPSIDKAIGPLRRKQLAICAGRPGMGKTAMAISYGLGAAQNGHGVLFVSLEMSEEELAERAAADLCFNGRGGVPYEAIRDGNLTREQLREVVAAQRMAADIPFSIVDAGHLTVGRLGMIVRRYKRRMAAAGHRLDLVIVDYLQLLTASGKVSNRVEAVSEISRSLKSIAKDQDLTVMALSQLSREVEKRPDRRPQLSDLRESGSIEQDADSVMFLYRPEYYLRQSEPDQNDIERCEWEASLAACEGKIEFICAKRRNGRTGSLHGEFWGANQAVRG